MKRAELNAWLQRYGLSAHRAQPVAQLDCEIHRIGAGAGTTVEQEFALRIYPKSRSDLAAIEAEVAWLAALAEAGAHVPRPWPDRQGIVIQAWQAPSDEAPRHALLLTWLQGRMHDRGLTPQRLRRVGMLCAQLHRQSARLSRAGRITTPRLAYTARLDAWASGTRPGAATLSPALRRLARLAASRLVRELDGFARSADLYGFVHGDLHPWNLLFTRDSAGAIDFSDCGWGHYALDLASVLQYLRFPFAGNHDHRAQYPALKAALLEGYARTHALPQPMQQHIETYIVARLFVTLDWILDDWPRPDHRAWGPGFLLACEAALAGHLAS